MLKKALAIATLLAGSMSANAALITQTISMSAAQTTNFTESFDFNKFDDMGGTRILNSVTLELEGMVSGSASAESLDASATTISLTLGANMTLETTDGTVLVTTLPVVDEDFAASAFDGGIDFGGTSGATFSSLSASQTETSVYTAGLDDAILALFIGSGTLSTILDASGASSASGAGNLITQFSTLAEGSLVVTYDWSAAPTPSVSEPASVAAIGLALVGFGFASRRRRVK